MREDRTKIWNNSHFFIITVFIILFILTMEILSGCSTAALGKKRAGSATNDCYIIRDELDGGKTTEKVSEILSEDNF